MATPEGKKELPKAYNASDYEDAIYKRWESSGFFNPDKLPRTEDKGQRTKSFSIVLPPPNVTGTLHMGHAAMLAIEDILIRFKRMQGFKTLWLPGTDHAAIATQSKVEDEIYKKEGKTKHDLGRDEFLRRVERFAKESHDTIINRIKKMGASADWSREAYTLDNARSLAVNTAFKEMYDLGLIYRGARIVNWDPKLQTTVADDEVEYKEEKTPFYYLKYGPFTIATARPETKFGDKYVVMHPNDKRYAKYKHGEKITLEWINGPVTATVIKDSAVDMEFGTGVMTITPWHDATDFQIASRHNLEREQVIDFKGKLLPIADEFAGLHIKKARPLIVEKLKAKGLIERTDENYVHRVAINYRGGGVIEPQIVTQWWIDVSKKIEIKKSRIKGIKNGSETTLKALMQTVIKNGQITIIPPRFEKIYFHWVNNLLDWCISRQLWYGHRIPAWYGKKSNIKNQISKIKEETYVGINPPKGEGWERDPDTLDTWFSSGLWTFSTLGWPKVTKDLKTFHPTDVLETGYDILFFWVARMILMTTALTGDIPFKTVYLHGLVRDAEGRKMSKSLGNTIDPLDMVEKYGADATRLSLIIGAAPGNDIKLSEDKIRGYRNFANKIWNAARFVLMHAGESGIKNQELRKQVKLMKEDERRLKELDALVKATTKDLEEFKLHQAGERLYHYFWHTFADKIIEETKPRLASGNESDQEAAEHLLLTILETNLKLLHPFMPFVTETIWQHMDKKSLLMIEQWPMSRVKNHKPRVNEAPRH